MNAQPTKEPELHDWLFAQWRLKGVEPTPESARFTMSEQFRPIRIRSVFAEDDMVVVVWECRGIATDGQPCESSYAWFMRLQDGKVIHGAAFSDNVALTELGNRVRLQS